MDSGLLNTVLLAFQVSSSVISSCRQEKNLKTSLHADLSKELEAGL